MSAPAHDLRGQAARAARIAALDAASRLAPLAPPQAAELDRLIAQETQWRHRLPRRIAATRAKLAALEAWAA